MIKPKYLLDSGDFEPLAPQPEAQPENARRLLGWAAVLATACFIAGYVAGL